MRPNAFAACLALSLATFVCSRAQAYRTGADLLDLDAETRVAWASVPVALRLNEQVPEGLATEDVSETLADEIDAWASASCGKDLVELDDITDERAVSGDGVNTVQWITEDWSDYGPSDASAATDVQYEERDGVHTIVEADVYLNAETMQWDERGNALGGASLSVVLRHELGHVLGLAHPCELDAGEGEPSCDDAELAVTLMHPSYADSAVAFATGVTSDEQAGLCFLYGSESTAEPEGDAGTIGDAGDVADAGQADAASSGEGEVGDPCSTADECNGMQCVAGFRTGCGGICTRVCDEDAPCPHGYQCSAVEGRSICVPQVAEESTSCAIAPAASAGGGRFALLVALVLLVCSSQRRRRSV